MNILGLAAPFGHDAAAALMVDGKVVAAAEEERFTRKKHADSQLPIHAIQYCLKEAGLTPKDIDRVAFPWSIDSLRAKRWEYFLRTIRTKPSRAYKKFFRNQREFSSRKAFVYEALSSCGFDVANTPVDWVEHHLAHMASSLYFSGMKEASVMSIDAGGEISSTVLGTVYEGAMTKVKEIVAPDSLGDFYSTITDYLGFNRGDGEYKVMGMAPYGDASKVNFDHIIWWDERRGTFHCHDDYVWVTRDKRPRLDKVYSKKMVAEFGPERQGDALSEPYIHLAAATQNKLERITVELIERYLKKDLERHGNLCFAGGCALNVALNRILLELPYVKQLWVQPAAHDAGTALGAAAYSAHQHGQKIQPMTHTYLGPEFDAEAIEDVVVKSGFQYTQEKDICKTVAKLLEDEKVVGWFQGRMEWGPRALGNRSILGNPTVRGTADKINAIIKFREQWRPFCPSILKEKGKEILGSDHPAPYMTIAFKATDKWKDKIPEVVHVDGTCRPQLVDKDINPRYYTLIEHFYKATGVPVLINTSLNRRGEPMVCSPEDAIKMFDGCGLKYMAIGDYLLTKEAMGVTT